jgi:hypothetical protein
MVKTISFEFPHFLNYTNIILLWHIPNVLPKSSCMGTLVLKSGIFRFYAPLRIPSKRKRAAVGKTLELPEAKYLYIKKMGKLKNDFHIEIPQIVRYNKQHMYILLRRHINEDFNKRKIRPPANDRHCAKQQPQTCKHKRSCQTARNI